MPAHGEPTLRQELRKATHDIHSRLDDAIGNWPIDSAKSYAHFLTLQFRVRSGVEAALETSPPSPLATPPPQSALIAHDLAELSTAVPAKIPAFEFSNSSQSIGAAWVLAGASLGNKAILVRRCKAGISGADRFLADAALPTYFRDMLNYLDQPRNMQTTADAISGATMVFAAFEDAIGFTLDVAA